MLKSSAFVPSVAPTPSIAHLPGIMLGTTGNWPVPQSIQPSAVPLSQLPMIVAALPWLDSIATDAAKTKLVTRSSRIISPPPKEKELTEIYAPNRHTERRFKCCRLVDTMSALRLDCQLGRRESD